MKKILFTVASVFIIAVSANAQTANVAKTDKATEKQAKQQMKQKQDEEIEKAIKDAGITEDKATQFKETMKLYGTKSTEVRKDASLTDEQQKEKLKALNQEKNAKLSEIAGADKYKEYNKIRKQQKQAENSTAAKQ
ncbi:MAG: hypothetical protein H0X70_08020 [Segetibacter sp.]|nr:hypothetical protein [Segetibacter sp.]